MNRYTSPSLSRLLAEAGMEQGFDGMVVSRPEYAWWQDAPVTDGMSLVRALPSATRNPVRALDLTDVIHELTRPRPEEKDARPLCVNYTLATFGDIGHRFTAWGPFVDESRKSTVETRHTDVEAAALVLLALLKEATDVTGWLPLNEAPEIEP